MQEGWIDGSEGEENPQGRQVWSMLPGLGQIGGFFPVVFFCRPLNFHKPIGITCNTVEM
jgi:hypothetical protein